MVIVAGACSRAPDSEWTSGLQCPTPGNLPFATKSHGYQDPDNAALASFNPRIKHETFDNLGGNSVQANVDVDDKTMPGSGPVDYRGVMGRTTENEGGNLDPLAGENVSLWWFTNTNTDPDPLAEPMGAWQQIGSTTTDGDGLWDLPSTGFIAPTGAALYAVLEADGTCAEMRDWLLPAGTKVIVTDIDGTLTTGDIEFDKQIFDGTYVPTMMKAADQMANAWAAKGYQMVYLTARGHGFEIETRTWLDQLGFPPGPVITETGGLAPDLFKTLWLQRMIESFGWDVFAAYGNAITDVAAYINVGVPLTNTFIIGPVGGFRGTTAIVGRDYSAHIGDFIAGQPDLNAI